MRESCIFLLRRIRFSAVEKIVTAIKVTKNQCFTHGSVLDGTHVDSYSKSKLLFKSYLVEIMDDSKCKPFLTDVLKGNYRNIICAKRSNGETINPEHANLDTKYDKIYEASDIREVTSLKILI